MGLGFGWLGPRTTSDVYNIPSKQAVHKAGTVHLFYKTRKMITEHLDLFIYKYQHIWKNSKTTQNKKQKKNPPLLLWGINDF